MLRNIILKSLMFVLTVGLLAGCDGCDPSTKPTPQPPEAGSALLVASQEGAGSMSVIDVTNQTVRLGAAGLGNIPNDIVKVGNKFYVINSQSGDMNVLTINADNTLTSLDTMELDRGRGYYPQYGVIASNGRMYISNFNAGSVTALDTATGSKTTIEDVGFGPQDIIAVDDNVYVCNSGYDPATNTWHRPGTVARISTVNDRMNHVFEVGDNPQFMALDNNRTLHVVCTGFPDSVIAGRIYKISVQTATISGVIYIGGTPGDIALTNQGYAYIAAGGWDTKGYVYRYKISDGVISNGPTDNNPIEVSRGASRIIAASDGSVYVSCYVDDRVDHIVGQTRMESYPVANAPGAMALIER